MTGTRAKLAFFDDLAGRWDAMEKADILEQINSVLSTWSLGPSEQVLDAGCGTGNSTKALLALLGPEGRVHALDPSSEMLTRAREKNPDPRVSWHQAWLERMPLRDGSIDRASCMSMWPHVDDVSAALLELRRVLRPGGRLHIWHLLSRERINAIHAHAGEAVRGDVLPEATVLAAQLQREGWQLELVQDEQRYQLIARRPD